MWQFVKLQFELSTTSVVLLFKSLAFLFRDMNTAVATFQSVKACVGNDKLVSYWRDDTQSLPEKVHRVTFEFALLEFSLGLHSFWFSQLLAVPRKWRALNMNERSAQGLLIVVVG